MGLTYDKNGLKNVLNYINNGKKYVDSAMLNLSASCNKASESANVSNLKRGLTDLENLYKDLENFYYGIEKAIDDLTNAEVKNEQLISSIKLTTTTSTRKSTKKKTVTSSESDVNEIIKETSTRIGITENNLKKKLNDLAKKYGLNNTNKRNLIVNIGKTTSNYGFNNENKCDGYYMGTFWGMLNMIKADLYKDKKVTKAQYDKAVKLINELQKGLNTNFKTMGDASKYASDMIARLNKNAVIKNSATMTKVNLNYNTYWSRIQTLYKNGKIAKDVYNLLNKVNKMSATEWNKAKRKYSGELLDAMILVRNGNFNLLSSSVGASLLGISIDKVVPIYTNKLNSEMKEIIKKRYELNEKNKDLLAQLAKKMSVTESMLKSRAQKLATKHKISNATMQKVLLGVTSNAKLNSKTGVNCLKSILDIMLKEAGNDTKAKKLIESYKKKLTTKWATAKNIKSMITALGKNSAIKKTSAYKSVKTAVNNYNNWNGKIKKAGGSVNELSLIASSVLGVNTTTYLKNKYKKLKGNSNSDNIVNTSSLSNTFKIIENVEQACKYVTSQLIDRHAKYDAQTYGNIEQVYKSDTGVVCASYVALVLYQTGLMTPEQINKYNYHYTVDFPNMLKAAGWTQVSVSSVSDLKPGDVLNKAGDNPAGHVVIYSGNGMVYDQNSAVIGTDDATGATIQPTGKGRSVDEFLADPGYVVWRAPSKTESENKREEPQIVYVKKELSKQAEELILKLDVAHHVRNPENPNDVVDQETVFARIQPYWNLIVKYSNKYGLDPYLVRALISQETGIFDENNVNGGTLCINEPYEGNLAAIGMMQYEKTNGDQDIEITNKDGKKITVHASINNLVGNPEEQIKVGCALLKQRLELYGNNLAATLTAYNNGDGGFNIIVNHSRGNDNGVPNIDNYEEVQKYVSKGNNDWLTDGSRQWKLENYGGGNPYYVEDLLQYYRNDGSQV